MTNPFERFYDTEIKIYESEASGSYSEGDTKALLGSLVCDLQPFYDNTESELHGLSEERKYKIYCDKTELIKNGRLVLFGGALYRVISVESWSFGMKAVMRCVENES